MLAALSFLLPLTLLGADPVAEPPAPAAVMTAGISRSLAEYRADRIAKVQYALTLDVTRRDTATGSVRITFDRIRGGDVILDFRGPSFTHLRVNGTDAAKLAREHGHLRIPARFLRMGRNTITADFASLIAASGASIIRYQDASDDATYLYTLLVPADANQLFPCFDQPDLKARVTLELRTPRHWNAVSNGALQRTTTGTSATTYQFAESEPISTYLIAFAAGPWATVTRTIDGRPITMYVRASRAHEAEADSLIAANARAATWLAKYFDRPFPFVKLDFVLAPAFPFGGMEHPGAIFYSEDKFIFRDRPAQVELLGREETIYHEVAHQWFGDLVTMRWFDDLWLKEGFATYMASRIRAAYASPAEAWKSFYLTYKPSAYAVDQTAGTISVWQPLDNLDQAKSNYGPIVYNKAPSILKQLNYLVGDSLFRLGLHRFLDAHAYGNATWRDLLDAIGDAAHRPLRSWGAQYILRPGMPVIDQTVRVDKNGTFVRLRQRPADSLSGQGAWPIRMTLLVRYADSNEQRLPLELRGTDTTIRVAGAHVTPPVFVFANAEDYAYASVVVDSASVFWLVDHIGTLRDPLLRAMAWEALWDQVRSARVSPMHYLSLVQRELPLERDEQISTALFQRTTRATSAYLSSYQRDTIAPEIEAMFRGIASDTSQSAGTRKLALNALIRITYTAAGTTLLDSLLTGAVPGITPPSQPTRWLIVTKLIELAAPIALQRVAGETRRDSTTDGQKRAFIAGAAYPDSVTKQRYFTRYFNDRSLNEEWVTASLGAFNALDAQALTRRYLRPALDSLTWIQQNRRIFFIGSWLEAFINGHSEPEDAAVVSTFLRDRASLTPDLRRKVLQAVDELNRTAAIRRTFANGLKLSQI